HARPRDTDGAAAVVEGLLAIEQDRADAMARQRECRRHADRAGAGYDDRVARALALALGRVSDREDRIVEIEGAGGALAGRSHAAPLARAVEEAAHHPLRLAGQEGLAECADAEIDGFAQRQFLPAPA